MKNAFTSFFRFIRDSKYSKFIIFIVIICLLFFTLKCLFYHPEVNLTCSEVEKIVLNDLGGGIVTACNLERGKYEVEIVLDHYEYEFIIDGNSGKILSYDSDRTD